MEAQRKPSSGLVGTKRYFPPDGGDEPRASAVRRSLRPGRELYRNAGILSAELCPTPRTAL